MEEEEEGEDVFVLQASIRGGVGRGRERYRRVECVEVCGCDVALLMRRGNDCRFGSWILCLGAASGFGTL